MRRSVIASHLERALRTTVQAPDLQLIELDGERPAVDEEREPWIEVKYGPACHDDWFGVVPAVARFRRARDAAVESLDLIVKVNPREGMARNFMPWIVEQAGVTLDRPYWKYRQAREFGRTDRERHVYGVLAPRMPSLAAFLPKSYGSATDEATGEGVLFLEVVTNLRLLDAGGAHTEWPAEPIDEVLRAMARWQADLWDVDADRLSWAAPQPTSEDMAADAPLWRAIIDVARMRFPQIMTDKAWQRRRRLIDTIADWHAVKDRLPSTLAHNDFNPRNVGFREDVLVLDWELAQRNSAHRDIVEFLTFALPPDVDRQRVDRHVETHRAALEALGVSTGVDPDTWLEGFRCELRVEAIDRAALQLLFGAKFPLPYVGRMNATIERLLDLYE
jgi:hypothetical protein